MGKPPKDNPDTYPPLGRMMTWVDRPGSADKVFWGLAVFCILLFLADFTYDKYGHFSMEKIPGFYGIFGFVMFTALILAAKALRMLIKRPENYYGDKAIDQESYPDEQLEKENHDGD